MFRTNNVSLTPLCAALMCVLLAGACSRPAAAEDDQKLAVVNVSLVFEKYNKVADVQRKIDADTKDKKEELNKRAEDLSKRNKEVEQLYTQQNQSEPVFDMVQHLRKDQYKFERDLTALNMDIQKAYTKDMRDVLTDIRVAVRNIAEKGGFQIVLRSPDTDDPDVKENAEDTANPAARDNHTYLEVTSPKTVAQLVERFNRNPVLFGAKTVDITQDVLTKLNDDYLKRSIIGGGKKP